VSDHQASYPIATMCVLLGVSSSGYYAWAKRSPSRRAQTDSALIGEISTAHAASDGTYGAPRVHAELVAKGIHVGRKRVARLMRQAGVAGVSRRRFVVTTVKDGSRQAPDLVDQRLGVVIDGGLRNSRRQCISPSEIDADRTAFFVARNHRDAATRVASFAAPGASVSRLVLRVHR
jgi:transposase InsO family protein